VSQATSVLHPSEVAARIGYFRKKRGLKGVQLAEACGVTPGTVSLWESGKTEPTHENLARAARACGVDLAEFWAAPIVIMSQDAER
jgi:transcriptional regulator with XRE-family HTH domain